MQHPLIETIGVEREYGSGESRFRALGPVSMTVNDGDSIAVVGQSGSGKSTLLHLLAALDRPSAGTVRYRGTDVRKLSLAETDHLRNRGFGFVFQQFHLDSRATVSQNVALPMMIAGIAPSRRRKAIAEVLDRLGLGERESSRVGTLSGGQRQRVAIARALINRPSIIFADEPTGALDSENGTAVSDLLFELNRTDGITLVVVTHSSELAERCDQVITLADGRIVDAQNARKGEPS